jgi:hypothetical protein
MNPHCSAAIIIYSYQTQAVRDLAWACFSPALLTIEDLVPAGSGINSCALQLTPQRSLWLEQLDHDASALLEHLAQRPTHRLGVYFEQLWHFFLQQDEGTDLIAHNLPVHDGVRTLGEFDCIYYSQQRRRHVHLELAVKYFLGLPRANAADPLGDAHEWLGPDRRDRLDTKLDQLLQHQIALSETQAATQLLKKLGIDELDREVVLKGYLFQPREAPPPPPPGFNSQCPLSVWVTRDQLEVHCAARSAVSFLVLPKMQWLSGALCAYRAQALTLPALRDRMRRHFEHDDYPLLIAALDRYGRESSRFFVTPENWLGSIP